MRKPLLQVAILLLLVAAPKRAAGQSSLLVRLADDAPSSLVAGLEAAGKQGLAAELLDGVVDRAALFPTRAGKASSAAPIRAYVLTARDEASRALLLERWASTTGVAYVQPNRWYTLDGLHPEEGNEANRLSRGRVESALTDPMLDSLDYLPVIDAYAAWSVTEGDPSVRIGFVDTGMYLEHPDLASQLWVNPGEDLDGDGVVEPADFDGLDTDGNGYVDDLYGYDFVDRPGSVEIGDNLVRDPDPSDDSPLGGCFAHGTNIAGVLAAAAGNGEGARGLAPGSRLVPLRAFGPDGRGEDDDIAAAIVYAAEQGVDVLNLSFGDVYYSPLMHEAIQYAVNLGTVVVASAGNVGGDDPHYPSDYPEVLSVVWLERGGEAPAARATYGPGIDLGAPGTAIFTTQQPAEEETDGEGLYGRCSGSSVAAPMVAATAALLRSADADLSPEAIRSILTTTAADIDAPGWDQRTGAGRLDMGRALQEAVPARLTLTSPAMDSGTSADRLPVIGTVTDPAFAGYRVEVQAGHTELSPSAWEVIATGDEQAWDDTLAVWSTASAPEGPYTVRVALDLRTGVTLTEQRRVVLDRSPPEVTLRWIGPALVQDAAGLQVDLEVDDLAEVTMTVETALGSETVQSDRRARRHGLTWTDAGGRGGTVTARIDVVNVAGQTATLERSIEVPAFAPNTGFLTHQPLAAGAGYLLPDLTDFDGDDLPEITFNRYMDGWLGDSLYTYEWDGADLRLASALVANVFPRDVGDGDGDGLQEILAQVSAATLLLEQASAQSFPGVAAFIDTTGLQDPFGEAAAFGARITDLDGDDRGELLMHNTSSWRLLEWNGTTYVLAATLDNPTGLGQTEVDRNSFEQPEAAIGDFDSDGSPTLVVGDSDGDWIAYEARGDDTYAVTWTRETNRYNAGSRFATGDFDGDGTPELVTFTQNWTQVTADDEREPDFGVVYRWRGTGDDAFVLADSLALSGEVSRHGTLSAADLDGDGRDELLIVHAARLYVLDLAGSTWATRYVSPETLRLRSAKLAVGDLDGDGATDLIAAGADDRLHRLHPDGAALRSAPPLWQAAFAVDETQASLRWSADGADSVGVYVGLPDGALDLHAVQRDSSLMYEAVDRFRVALRAWRGGEASPLSEARTVRPHRPATVSEVAYPDRRSVELVFSEALDPAIRPAQFTLDGGAQPQTLVQTRGGYGALLRFKETPPQTADLRWTAVRDAEGTPLAASAARLAWPDEPAEPLIIAAWSLEGRQDVRITFSKPVVPALATNPANYRVHPDGVVAQVTMAEGASSVVRVRIDGRALGAVGGDVRLEVIGVEATDGAALADEGRFVHLVEPATSLDDVFVYPNPYRAAEHREDVMVAGLPEGATVEIVSTTGQHVRTLRETDGDGGVRWDVRTETGALVPSGIYLVRVEDGDAGAVLQKVAVIR